MRSIVGAVVMAAVLSGCFVSLGPPEDDVPVRGPSPDGIDAGPGVPATPPPVSPGAALRLPWAGPLGTTSQGEPPTDAPPTPTPEDTPAPTTPATPAPPTPTPPPPSSPAPSSSPPSPSSPGGVRLAAGADAGPSRYVPLFEPTPDGTGLRVELRGVPEARVEVASLFVLENLDGVARSVEVRVAGDAPPASVQEARFAARDTAGAALGALDLLVAPPTPALRVQIPPGETVTFSWALALGTGAGADNAAFSTTITFATVS